MHIDKNARRTFGRRLEMVQDVLEHKLTDAATAAKHPVSVPTVRKWLGRSMMQGEPGLRDVSCSAEPTTGAAAHGSSTSRTSDLSAACG